MAEARLPARTTTSALGAAALAAAVSGVAAVVASLPWQTTYAALSPRLALFDAVAAASLLTGGLWLSLQRPRDTRGPITLLLVVGWSGTQWVGWQDGPDLLRSLGVLAQAALLPLVVHIVARTWPDGRGLRPAVPWLYAASLSLAGTYLLVADPSADPACWQNCTVNAFLAEEHAHAAAALARTAAALSSAIGLMLLGLGVALAVTGRPAERAVHLPVLAPSAVVGLVATARGALLLARPAEDPAQTPFVTLHAALALALAGVGVGVGLVARRARLATVRSRRLAQDLAWSSNQPVSILLGDALGDPSVAVTYRALDPPEWVDAAGHRVPPPDLDDGAILPVTRGGRIVAAVRHDPDAAAGIDLAAALGPAGRLAVENEALRALQQARVRDLRDSQRRIVEAADAERSRLERNLHDAAQVSVLALTASVHRALRGARDSGEEQIVTRLLQAADQVQGTMDELRTLAGSIHPAIVDTAGLGPALHALADRTSVRVEVVVPDHARVPAHVEHAAYAAANEVLRTAAAQGEDDLQLRVLFTTERLTLIVDGTTQEVTDALRDRAGAVGGTATSTGAQMEVTLPCA